MLNFSLTSFVVSLQILTQETRVSLQRAAEIGPGATVTGQDKERLEANLKYVSEICVEKMLLQSAEHRLSRIFTSLRTREVLHVEMVSELGVLVEAIQDDIKTEYFYHYPHQKGVLVLRVPGDWASTIASFKSATPEIEDAVDCFALDKPTASVFHLMRIAEHGLRALARERKVKLPKGKPIEWGTWQDLIREVKASADNIGKTKRAGPGKDEALAFYNGAVAHQFVQR